MVAPSLIKLLNHERLQIGTAPGDRIKDARIFRQYVEFNVKERNLMTRLFRQYLFPIRNDKRGVTIIEYALLAALIGVALVTSLSTLKNNISSMFTNIATSL